MSSISAGTSVGTALVSTGDTTGDLVLKTGSSATTAVTISGSNQAVTLAQPLAVTSGGTGATTASAARTALGTNDAANITTGTLGTARLGSGTANSTTFLRGDQTWATVSGGVTSLNGQTGAITNTDFGAIGSYVAAFCNALTIPASGQVLLTPGGTYAGSTLFTPSNTAVTNGQQDLFASGSFDPAESQLSLGLSGTWRLMSSVRSNGIGANRFTKGLFVRIS